MSQTSSCSYNEGQYLNLTVIPDGDCDLAQRTVQVKVLENISQTLSWTGVVTVEHGRPLVSGHSVAFLKLFDRKSAQQLRAHHGGEQWTPEIEQSYIDALGTNGLANFMHHLQDVEDYAEETCSLWDAPQKEAFFTYELRRMWETECEVYHRLRPHQGKSIPKFLAAVELEVGEESMELEHDELRVKGILLEYVVGCSLLQVPNKFPTSCWQYIAEQAISKVRTLDTKDILNKDVDPRNFVIAKLGTSSNPSENNVRVCMVDFGLCRIREEGELDWEWASAKLEYDEEGELVKRMTELLRDHKGFVVRIEKSRKYEMFKNMGGPSNSNSSYDPTSSSIYSPTSPPPTQVAALYTSQLVPAPQLTPATTIAASAACATPIVAAGPSTTPTTTSIPISTSEPCTSALAVLPRRVMQPDRIGSIDVTWPVLPQRAIYAQAPVNLEIEDLLPLRDATEPVLEDVSTFEYLDHTADVQIHAWGRDFETALAASAVAVHGYMVTLSEHEPTLEVEFVKKGHDLNSMVYNFLDEALYHFHARGFVMKQMKILEVNRAEWSVRALARGGIFTDGCTKGTEVKAITYSNLRVEEGEDSADIYVIVDI